MWGSRLTLVVTLAVLLAATATREEEEEDFLPVGGEESASARRETRRVHRTRSENSSIPQSAQAGDDSLDDGVRSEQPILHRRLEEVLSVLGESGDVG